MSVGRDSSLSTFLSSGDRKDEAERVENNGIDVKRDGQDVLRSLKHVESFSIVFELEGIVL